MLRVLRRRDFRLLFAGALVSQAGDYVLFVALPFWIFSLTGSAAATGGMFAALRLPQLLLSPVAGVFVDRWDRKRTMIAADLVRAGIMCGFFAVHSADQVWIIYLLGFSESVASRLFLPARAAALPLIVGRELLAEANAAMGFSEAVGQLGGPALGGVLMAVWGPHGAAAADGISYLVSATAIACMRVPPLAYARSGAAGAVAAVASVWRDLIAGLRVVAGRPALRTVVAVLGVFMLSQGIINVLLVVLVSKIWHGGARELGWMVSAQGIGALIAAPLIGPLAGRFGPRTLIVGGGVLTGTLFAVVVNMPSIYPALGLIALAGIGIVFLFVGAQTMAQLGSDDDNRGRVSSLNMTTVAASTLLSTGLASALAGVLGTRPLLDLAALAMFLGGLIALLGPSLQPTRRPVAAAEAELASRPAPIAGG